LKPIWHLDLRHVICRKYSASSGFTVSLWFSSETALTDQPHQHSNEEAQTKVLASFHQPVPTHLLQTECSRAHTNESVNTISGKEKWNIL
jgi:hypothetical protein